MVGEVSSYQRRYLDMVIKSLFFNILTENLTINANPYKFNDKDLTPSSPKKWCFLTFK